MGRFLSIVAVLAACGDNLESGGTGGPNPGANDGLGPNGTDNSSARLVPTVCGAQSWSAKVTDLAMDVSIAPRPDGAAILAVPEAGGSTLGYVLDTRMNMVGDGKVIDFGSDFGQVTASLVGDRIVASSIDNGTVFVNLLDNDLGNPQWVAKLPGSFIGEPAFSHVQSDLVMPIAGDAGLTLVRFADSLEPLETKLVLATKPATGLATAQNGVATLSAWSTEGECYLMMNMGFAPGPYGRAGVPCPEPRLAMNEQTSEGALVFESADGVRLMSTYATQMGGDSNVLRTGYAPRIVFDGKRFWISYISERGDIIVGFLDQDRHYVSMSLNGPQPFRHAYELVMVMGAPWVFAADETGYSAHRMCVDVL